MLLGYAKEWNQLIIENEQLVATFKGDLSDIAAEVTAIPLETTPECILAQPSLVKREGENIFLVSKGQLYRFDHTGKFINRITPDLFNNERLCVIDYVLDPENKEVILVDNQLNALYYQYDGSLIERKQLSNFHPLDNNFKLFYHNRHIWVTAEVLRPAPASGPAPLVIEKRLYKYDTAFHKVEENLLTHIDLERFYMAGNSLPEMAICDSNIYTHAVSLEPEMLLQDTLFLLSRNHLEITADSQHSILPLRINDRYLFSSFYSELEQKLNYTFCYDRKKKEYINMPGGLQDNFYHTGAVADLHPLDLYHHSVCYLKDGASVADSFPGRSKTDNPVLFIVKLKA